jgi:hypothetical protein
MDAICSNRQREIEAVIDEEERAKSSGELTQSSGEGEELSSSLVLVSKLDRRGAPLEGLCRYLLHSPWGCEPRVGDDDQAEPVR